MIKCTTPLDDKDHKLLILGLSNENIKRLKQNKPIHINLKEMGDHDIGEIYIFTGNTEESMMEDLSKHFNLNDTTLKASIDEMPT